MQIKTPRKQIRSAHMIWVGAVLILLMLLLAVQSTLADSSGTSIPGNLVVNGSFEQNPDPSGAFHLPTNSNPMVGWTQETICGTEFWGHSLIANGIPQDGHWLLELDANCNGKIQQDVPTIAGASYSLQYHFAARLVPTWTEARNLASNALRVDVNGVQVDFVNAIVSDFTTWRQFSHVFTATGSTTTISFEGAGTNDGAGSLLDNISLVQVSVPTLAVDIDIKPGSDANAINPKSKGVIPVAILGGANLDIDVSTVRFGPNGASVVHEGGHIEGNDLVLHFRTQATGIQKGDTTACLTGKTNDGTLIEGCDGVKIAGKR